MSLHLLRHEEVIRRSRSEVFAFFSRPENLSLLTPPSMHFRILTPPPVPMREGALIDYTVRIAGYPVRWTTLITSFEPGESFVDVQLKGPYSFWHHTHIFREHPGGTLMTDEVRYQLPFGPVGEIVHSLAVRRKLAAIFDYRSRAIAIHLGTPDVRVGAAP
jgi:ligand-binding SRPBCC domain-containing protein